MIADETQNNKNSNNHPQPVFLCEIMQLAAFLCVICAICGRITRKRTQSIYPEETPRRLPLISLIYADKPQNNKNSLYLKLIVFLCDIMQPAAFLCAICVICGRIFTQEYSIYIAQMKTQKSPADLADLRRQRQVG